MAKSKPPFSPRQFNLTYFAIALMLVFTAQVWFVNRTVEQLAYSEFQQLLEDGEIKEATIRDNTIHGKYVAQRNGKDSFVTNRVEPEFAKQLEQYKVKFSGAVDDNWLSKLLSWVLPVLLFFGLWMLVFRKFAEKQGLGGMMNVGKSKAKVYVEKSTGVTFDDVAGVDEAKSELTEIVSFLKEPDKYGRLGARIPKGILLVGPPGTGKTLLARAVAGEAAVPFFSISGSEFVEMFVGVGAARVRDLFEQARNVAPCIIFIDELDSLGKARSANSFGGGSDEKEQTLNQLLNELDGFDPREGIVLLAATNRPEILDPALLRAGRFDRQIVVDRPDRNGREEILRVHLRKVPTKANFPVEEVAGLTPGFSGADLANLVNEAAIIATRRDGREVGIDDITQAVERIVAGSERRGRLLNPAERERVAWHEMGHALAAASLPGTDPVHKVSIIPRSIGALGYTMTRPTEDRFLITTDELKNRMVVLMAGRASEQLSLGSISTGASDDLAKTTDIARQMVTTFGMDEGLGQAVLERQGSSYLSDNMMAVRQKDFSEQTAREIDIAVRGLIDQAFDEAHKLLIGRRADLDAGVQMLLEKETITPDDFPALRQKKTVSPDDFPALRQKKT
ncbi:MAG: ATP-dependent zinc metalloprotease FtsH [Burkholderiaceae bacterium]